MISFKEYIEKGIEEGKSPIKGEDNYTWHKYDHHEQISLNFRGKEHALNAGDHFGVRYAASSPDKKRVVMKKHGINKVFSLPHDATDFLLSRSKKL